MAWIKIGESLAPVNYYATIHDYNKLPNTPNEKVLENAQDWTQRLMENWGDLRGWWLNGALNITLVTQNAVRPHTNTDIVVLDNAGLLEEMANRARKLGLFLTSRERSSVPLVEKGRLLPEIKHEKYVLADPLVVAKNRSKNKDYMFCAFDQEGRIVEANTPETRVRVFVHYLNDKDETYVSVEDGRKIDANHLNYQQRVGRVLAADLSDHERVRLLFSAHIAYMLPIHQEAINKLEKKMSYRFVNVDRLKIRIQKHHQEIQRIKQYLAAHPEYLHSKRHLS